MANDQIKEFLREKKAEAIAPGIDWSAKRESWIRSVDNLFHTIDSDYLGSAGIREMIQVETRTMTVREPRIGTYSIPKLTLSVGDEQVHFSPKGAVVVGAEGRVDVQGDRGEATLVRQSGDQWSIVVARSPKLELVPLNEESFLQLLRSVMR